MKEWKDLTFADNYMFCKIMENEDLCKEMLEILLHIKVGKLVYNKTEHQIENGFFSKGIRMDVYVEDSDKIYDIEMQTGNYKDLPLRARYYQGAMDLYKIKKRNQINELKETFILFICVDDPFNYGLPVYTIKSEIIENSEIPYNDKTHTVFYNCSAYNSEKDRELKGLLEYISTHSATTDFSEKIESNITNAKTKNDWEDSYMFLSTWLQDELNEGLKKGKEELDKEKEILNKQKTELNKEQIKLSKERTELSKKRTELSKERTELSKKRTELSKKRTELSKQKDELASIKKQLENEKRSEKLEIAKKLLNSKIPISIILQSTGLSENDLNKIRNSECAISN